MRRLAGIRAGAAVMLAALATASAGGVEPRAVEIVVRTPDGAPVANAVVELTARGGAAEDAGDAPASGQLVMSQHDLTFDPHVLVAPAGSDVAFPNRDTVRHHVYSFSDAKTFELRLYGGEAEHVVHFDRPGVVPLGCNIHDNMIGFIYVSASPYATTTDAEGRARLDAAPPGDYALTVWHELLRGDTLERRMTVDEQGASQTVTIELRRQRRRGGYD